MRERNNFYKYIMEICHLILSKVVPHAMRRFSRELSHFHQQPLACLQALFQLFSHISALKTTEKKNRILTTIHWYMCIYGSSKCSVSFEYIVSHNMNRIQKTKKKKKKTTNRKTDEKHGEIFGVKSTRLLPLFQCRIWCFLILCEFEARISDILASTHQMFANYIVASIFFHVMILCHIVFILYFAFTILHFCRTPEAHT